MSERSFAANTDSVCTCNYFLFEDSDHDRYDRRHNIIKTKYLLMKRRESQIRTHNQFCANT